MAKLIAVQILWHGQWQYRDHWRPVYCRWYGKSLGAGLFGFRTPVDGEFYFTRLDGLQDPPRLPSNVYRSSFPVVKQLGNALTIHLHLEPRLKKRWSYTSDTSSSLRLHDVEWTNLYLYRYHYMEKENITCICLWILQRRCQLHRIMF